MGDTVIEKLNELQNLDPQTHWFCPATSLNPGPFYDEDLLSTLSTESAASLESRTKAIAQAEKRQDDALEASKIYAFEGGDAKPYQDQFSDMLKTQLTRCDICVRQYHRARTVLLTKLEQEFDTDDVKQFMNKFDGMNIERIVAGLRNVRETLHDLPPDQRNITSVGTTGTFALFEALNCIPFLKGDFGQEFDTPFRLVQSNRKLKLPNYAPGMTAFLFSHEQERSSWAFRNFTSIKRPLTKQEFEYGVKPFWEAAMSRVNITYLEADFLSTFWKASKVIISKLTPDLVVNQLRTMETNLYTLGLEHFQIDKSHFDDLLWSYLALLDLNPRAFWDAFGNSNISAQAVAETIFRAPVLERMLKTTQESEPLQLEEKLQFTVMFVQTIRPENLVPPARFIIDMLLHKLQDKSYSRHACAIGWQKGMACLLEALKAMNTGSQRGGPIASHLLQVVAADHIQLVLQELDGVEKKTEISLEHTEHLCLEIVQNTLALEIHGLAYDRTQILNNHKTDQNIQVGNTNVWKLCMRSSKPGGPILPATILSGLVGFLPLEKFSSRQLQSNPAAKKWNDAFTRIAEYVANDFLESLDSFTPEHLVEIIQDRPAAYGLITLLFNGEPLIHHAALNVLKVISSEDTRRDSLLHVVRVFTAQIFAAINSALTTITSRRVFAPCMITLNICTDLLSCLCDSHDGLLRSRELQDAEMKSLNAHWEIVWQLLGMIFEQMEPWSTSLGNDKQMMQDFCRSTMDFADYAFEQYSIFASSLVGDRSTSEFKKELLSCPKSKFGQISKWLRLRDDYLVSKAVGLTCKILARLTEVDVHIDDVAATYLEDMVIGGEKDVKIRTKLSMSQKAEIQRAMELHLGASFAAPQSGHRAPKQSTLQGWASSGRSSGTSTPVGSSNGRSRQGAIDVDAWSEAAKRAKDVTVSDSDAEYKKLMKSMDASERYKSTMQKRINKQNMPVPMKAAPKPPVDQKDFLLKRQKEKEEADKRRAMALAKAKGVSGDSFFPTSDIVKGDSVMVSSDEEEDEDEEEEDLDADLFGPSNKASTKPRRPDVDPHGAIGLRPEQKNGPTRIHRMARSSKDMRARLAPDLTALHKVILKWEFFHDGDYPPASSKYQFKQVTNTFTDPTTYQQTFEPLLTLEAWQNLVKSREENTNKPYEVKIQSRTNVDSFVEVSSTISHAENREIALQEGDIVLLSKAKRPHEDPNSPHCLARVYRVKRQKGHCEIVYQITSGAPLASSLVQQAVVTGIKVQSIIPLEREYGALQGLQYFDLCPQIVRAKPSNRVNASEKQIAAFQEVYNVNRAQSEAINAAMENEGFSLIQGPPGSGKTKTIVAIVGCLLSGAFALSAGAQKISMPKAHGSINGVGGGSNNNNDVPVRKLLVCAPSNAAVDELVMRLKEGITTKAGRRHDINVVRIGRSEAINQQVLDVTMDELVSRRLGTNDNDQRFRQKNAELFKEHESVSTSLRELYKKRDNSELKGKALTDLEDEIVKTRKRKNELGVRIDNAKDAERNAGREAELNRKKAQQAILDDAHVICATLSGSGHDMFQSLNIEFETVIIDEAAQCVEMSSLIPLKYGCVKCIMVGDPKQLPPTVFSKEAARFAYEQSLFVRMQNNHPDKVHLLDTQYRMHPDISIFPSRTFYDGLLKDGDGMSGLRQRPWHESPLLAPYRFFDVAGQHQAAPKGHSLVNFAEIDVAIALFERLTIDFSNYEFTSRVGIITPYKSQLRALKDKFSARFGNNIFDTIDFNTTDAFQGRESEIIIFSCVRASAAGGIGFLQDIRRMNVGLTRAKSSLWVLGNSESLSRGEFWKKLVDDARARDRYTTGNLLSMLKKATVKSAPQKETYRVRENDDMPSKQSSVVVKSQEVSEMPKFNESNPRATTAIPTRQLDDRMEGVTYRFEDRVGRKPASNPASRTERSTPQIESVDIEMTNAESPNGDRASTPASNGTSAQHDRPSDLANSAHDQQDSKPKPLSRVPTSVAPSVPHRANKRPAPNLFIPRKQSRPK